MMEINQKIIRFKRHVLYRIEKRGILVCDCQTGESFMFPKHLRYLFGKLKSDGIGTYLGKGKYKTAIEDLLEINFLELE